MFVDRLVAVARADGVIDDTERAAINRVCALIGLNGSFARGLMK
jgi:tellurite resistance protein